MKSEIKDNLEPADMAAYIDHTLLKADARGEDIDALCGEAKEYRFCSVCVNTTWVGRCAANLRGTGVKVCCVVGFPLGAMVSAAKAFEAQTAVAEGATEVDMVINIGALKDRDLALVEGDIRGVKKACGKALLKVIIETALLTTEEIVLASEIVKKAGADFVKTSTGFSTHGATVEHVALMRKTVGPDMGVKAAGGVRTFEDAVAMIKAGATRLGTSGGVKIVQGKTIESGY